MDRNEFLKISALLSGGLLLPSFVLNTPTQTFTRAQLIGKGNPDIEGSSYTSTMHKETSKALQKMTAAAAKENIKIEVVSAFRSFQRQKEIFESKYVRYTKQGLSPKEAIEKIILYSTIPGTSRHHWGTDIDIIDGHAKRPKDVLLARNYHGTGPFCKMKEWLNTHAEHFGFYEVYTDAPARMGFAYEPWHLSYAPISIPMLKAYKKLDLKSILTEENVMGSEHFDAEFIAKYKQENILDINPILL